ncbi:MAG: sialate O-acetylesterase [Myxococcales bacterium]
MTVSLEDGKRHLADRVAIADSDGRWLARLPAISAGGPYRLRITGSREVSLHDVLFGDVWLASGQSNMEWKVRETEGASSEITAAQDSGIRVLKVPNRASALAEASFEAEWWVCSPETVADFTALGYFFASKLRRALHVPIGIIDASWGGTYVEPWMSLEALRPAVPNLAEVLAERARQSTCIEQIRDEYQERVRAWERNSLPADPGNLGMIDGWASPEHDDSEWQEMDLPRFWQSEGLAFNGVVWFRKAVEIPKSWCGHDLLVKLGAIDDFDQTYFNGVQIGEHPDGTPDAYRISREYEIPGTLVRPGINLIAVRVFDHCGNGGFSGPRMAMTLCRLHGGGRLLSLAGPWKYAVELEIPLVSLDVFRSFPPPPPLLAEQHAPAALYHGMIAPLVPYGLAGFLWYQGESNVSEYATYRERLIALIRDWRTRFAQGTLPFLLVQLAGYRATSEWPHFREAQAQARSEPRVFMATAIDVGDPDDIHPRNKKTVAERLARLALKEVYEAVDGQCHGPEFDHLEIHGQSVHAYFRYGEGLHTSDGSPGVLGFELAGSDGGFRPAQAYVDGNHLVIQAHGLDCPVMLRYAWRDLPSVNLVNADGLPALPFRTDGAAPK